MAEDWIVKPGRLPSSQIEILNDLDQIFDKAKGLKDGELATVRCGIEVGPQTGIKRIIKIIIVGGDTKAMEKKYGISKNSVTKTKNVIVPGETKEITRTGYEFAGWVYYDSNGDEVFWDFDSPVYSNVDLYAKWYSKKNITKQQKARVAERKTYLTNSFDFFERFNNKEPERQVDKWDYVASASYGILPILLILLTVSMGSDIKVIIWYRRRKKKILQIINQGGEK